MELTYDENMDKLDKNFFHITKNSLYHTTWNMK